ncbi:MAG TPA: hypothetical protein VGG10_16610 [Rhizomicrobium sp.]|jgi:hypothetical protein
MRASFGIACALALALSASPAVAAGPFPASVVGIWNINANQSTLTLNIVKQKGTSPCKNIVGVLHDSVNGNADITGFYCPFSGRISFLRMDPTSKQTYQTWTGNLSYPGSTTYMAGEFAQEVGTTPGEYDFFGTFSPAG